MDCSKRIFILNEKYGDRYVHAVNKEATAKAIVLNRVFSGTVYDDQDLRKIDYLAHLEPATFPYYKFLKSRNLYEYEGFKEIYVEEII